MDELDRGPKGPTQLDVSCDADGSDLRCPAIANARNELYGCPIPEQDVTADASWLSSDDAVGAFTRPGILEVRAPGQVVISARWGVFRPDGIAFSVAPGSPPERLSKLYTRAVDERDHALSGVAVEVRPERGASQACVTGPTGVCDPLWVFTGSVTVRGNKEGYQPAETVVTGRVPPSFFLVAMLRLVPLP